MKNIIKKLRTKFHLFVKFGIVGLTGTVVNLIIFTILIHFNVNYLIAATFSFFVAVSNNFCWNFLWTFKGKAKHTSIRSKYGKFFTISLINFGVNLIFLQIFVMLLSHNMLLHDMVKVTPFAFPKIVKLVSQIIGIGIATSFNFVGNYYITFREKK